MVQSGISPELGGCHGGGSDPGSCKSTHAPGAVGTPSSNRCSASASSSVDRLQLHSAWDVLLSPVPYPPMVDQDGTPGAVECMPPNPPLAPAPAAGNPAADADPGTPGTLPDKLRFARERCVKLCDRDPRLGRGGAGDVARVGVDAPEDGGKYPPNVVIGTPEGVEGPVLAGRHTGEEGCEGVANPAFWAMGGGGDGARPIG